MSGAVAFDTLKFVERLEEGGFTHAQAKATAEAFADATGEQQLATKADLHAEAAAVRADLRAEIVAVKADLKEVEARLEANIKEVETRLKANIRDVETRLDAKIETSAANLKVDILRWLVVTQIALAGFIFAAIKFVK